MTCRGRCACVAAAAVDGASASISVSAAVMLVRLLVIIGTARPTPLLFCRLGSTDESAYSILRPTCEIPSGG